MLRGIRPFAAHLRGKERLLGLLFLLGLAGSAASLATPLLGKAFIDAVATRRNFAAVPPIAAALVGLAVLDLLLGLATRLAHTHLSARLLVELRERLFACCLRAPLGHLEEFRHGDLLSRFGSDLPSIQGLLVDGMLGGLQNALFLGVAAAILVRLCPSLALWSFAGVLLALLVAGAFRAPVETMAQGIRRAMADLSHFLSERLGALRALRLHGAQAEDEGRFRRVNAEVVRRVLRFQVLDAAAAGVPGLLLTLGLAWIYLLGGRLLESGEISLGTFVAFVLYQGRLYGPARGLLGLVRSLQEARVSLERVAEVLAAEPGAADPGGAGPQEGVVALDAVTFGYPGKDSVLREVCLEVASGERVAIFGASGVGKSTIVQLLFGLREPEGGRVLVEGAEPGKQDPAILRRALGYAGAEPFLLHATVEENLRYGRPEAETEAILRAARLACAHEFILSLPEGYRTVIGGRGLALSDGQRQRLGLARLILQAPRILVLDEAFSGLDPDTEARVRANLWASFPDRTILCISHRQGGLDQFDRLLLLRNGRVGRVGPEELRRELGGEAHEPGTDHFNLQPTQQGGIP